MVGSFSADGQTVSGWGRSKDYVRFRRRVRMASFETFRTFEMILAVSLTRLSSRLTPKDSLVENLTITQYSEIMVVAIFHWISMRTITSGSTHPICKKSRAFPG